MSDSMTVDTVENGSGGMFKAYTSKNTKNIFSLSVPLAMLCAYNMFLNV